MVMSWTDVIGDLHAMWEEAALSARDNLQKAGGKKNTTSKGGVKQQARALQRKDPTTLTEDDLLSLLEFSKEKAFSDGSFIPVRINTPTILIEFAKEFGHTLENYPLAMNVYKARQALSNEEEWDGKLQDKPHDLSAEEIVAIVRSMNNPSYLVYQSENERFAEIVRFERDGGKEKAYAIIDFFDVDKNPEVMNGYKGGKYNILVTIYPSENNDELKTYLHNKDHRVITGEDMKKKGLSQRGLGSQVPAHLNDKPFFDNSILHVAENSQEKNSDRELDHAGKNASKNVFGAESVDIDSSESGVKNQDRENNPYSYESIISKPDMKITALKGNILKNRADVVAEAKKNAAKIGKINPRNGGVSVYVNDLKSDVLLGTDGLKHGLRRANKDNRNPNYSVTLQAGEILKNSVVINELNPKKEDASDGYVLLGMAKDTDDNLYIVRSIINRFSDELSSMDVLYAINAKKESAAKNTPRFAETPLSVTDSNISISHLLDYVNKYFPDILSKDVLRHYGHAVRPTGELGSSVRYQDRDPDAAMVSTRALLANALESTIDTSTDSGKNELRKLSEYKAKVGELEKLHAMWEDAALSARDNLQKAGGKKNTTSKGGVTLSDRFVEDKYYARQIDKLDLLKSGGYITVGKIVKNSPVNKVGLPDGNLYFDVSKILKEMRERKDKVSAEVMKGIPAILDNPILITEYANGDETHSINVYGNLFIGSSPVVVGVMIGKHRNGSAISKIQTVHPNRNVLSEATDENTLYLGENKKETKSWFQALGTQTLPLGGTKFGFIRSISQISQKSQLKKSDRDTLQDISEDGLSYNSLVALPDLIGTTLNKNQQVKMTPAGKIDDNWVCNQVFSQCETVNTNAPLPVHYLYSDTLGKNVEITKGAIRHGYTADIAHKNKKASPKDILNARASLNLHDLLETAIVVNLSHKYKNKNSPFAYVMMATMGMERYNGKKEYYAVRMVVQERIGEDPIIREAEVLGLLSAVNAKKIDLPHPRIVSKKNTNLRSSGQFGYSIANLIHDVKDIFPDTFSEDVYNHLGMKREENDHFSKHLLYQDRYSETSPRSLLANALETTIDTSTDSGKNELRKLSEYKAKVGELEKLHTELQKVNGEIKEISFTKGGDRSKLVSLNAEKTKLENKIAYHDMNG